MYTSHILLFPGHSHSDISTNAQSRCCVPAHIVTQYERKEPFRCLPACDRLGMSTAFQPPCLPTRPVCTSYIAIAHIGILSATLLATCIHDQTPCCDADGTVMLVLGLGERLIVLFVCADTDCMQIHSTSWRGGSEMQQCCRAMRCTCSTRGLSSEPADLLNKQFQRGSP